MRTNEGHFRRGMRSKALTQILDLENWKVFRLHEVERRTRMGSTMITFTPEGIIIHGDLSPGRRGVISDLGYGLGWFSSSLGGGYLCEKFLAQGWHEEIALDEIKGWLDNGGGPWGDDEPASPEVVEKLTELIDRMERNGPMGEQQFYEGLMDVYDDPDLFDDGGPGWGYDPVEAGWLIAIQARFAELYCKDLRKDLADGQEV